MYRTLPAADEVVEGAERLVDRVSRVVAVQLVQVDVVGLQAPERGVDRGQDVLAGVAAVERRRPGRPKHFVATMKRSRLPREPAAEDLLGAAPGRQVPAERVDVGRCR